MRTLGEYQSVERALRVLEELADHGPRGVSELAAALGLDKSAVSRMMKTLSALGYAELAGQRGRYELGPKILYLGRHYLDESNLLVEARPFLKELAGAVHATTVIAMPVGAHVLVLHNHPSPERLRVQVVVGETLAPHASAMGKVLLATMLKKERARFLGAAPLARFTPSTITDRRSLDALLVRVAREGYAIESGEEHEGVGCIAAPVREKGGRWFAAISATGPLQGTPFALDDDHLRLVVSTALALSERLGYKPEGTPRSKLVS
jgi:DNA-binding IclR family transcriptional regulator